MFWQELAGPVPRPAGTRLLVVPQGPQDESVSEIARLAHRRASGRLRSPGRVVQRVPAQRPTPAGADFNTTGYVDGNRYAVAILARGPISTYGSPISRVLSATARQLLPGGQFPDPPPTVRSLSRHAGQQRGGQTVVVVHGTGVTRVSGVTIGRRAVQSFRVLGPRDWFDYAPPPAS